MDILSEKKLELGEKSEYQSQYNPEKIFPIPRARKRMEIGIDPQHVPFNGFDLWNHYEVSWLNEKGKPMVATAEIIYDCHSPNIIESKSLKLYFNTLNNTHFKSLNEVEKIVTKDLSASLQSDVLVRINALGGPSPVPVQDSFIGECIDHLDISCSIYSVEPSFLTTSSTEVEETLYSDLLKSNCLVTFQPDWGSVWIQYKGPKIDREGLLRYIVSFRNHNEFHEQCIERIFIDIKNRCQPTELTVYGRYTRRGGLDINPYRTTHSVKEITNIRLPRQ
ncbi:NADPH-dependent 7-cyano-7-deazaguanine reductase QueF [Legionella sp. km772]|uniref:NADPH-dependent 7-cyano-7-deazaguanine reductase QueF n=1 Tax=Legionella sp. km772 TaxID=2498111 RepID=UPI001EECB115|nr:NADPH-dependent 7-cyano-7-deazaguanine reductase QueF [Legionella sp. km772]